MHRPVRFRLPRPTVPLLALLLLGACAGDEASRSRPEAAGEPAPAPEAPRDRIALGDAREVEVAAMTPFERQQVARAWQQFRQRSRLWRVSLHGIVSQGGAGRYVLAENLFRHFFTASVYSQRDEIERVAQSAAIIGEPAVAYFAKPLVEDLVPLGKPVVAEVPDPNDPKARIKKTFHHFQIDDFIRRDAARVLATIGEPAVPTLASEALLVQARPSGRRYAAFALGRIGTPRAVEALTRHYERAQGWQDRAAAVQALGLVADEQPAARAVLQRALQDPDRFVRKKADEALAGKTKLPL